uniref:Tail length tape measure protein n=2 Tax=unclassified Rosemountvirus TaxID=2738372 RepID=A0AAU8GFX8_9CAUD
MATIIDSFIVDIETRVDPTGFQLVDHLANRFVVTLGDVINIAERAANALGSLFKPALEADVVAAKLRGFQVDVDSTWQKLFDMSQQMGTPFAEALDGFTKLKAYGVDPLNGSLNTLKTIAAASGGDLHRIIIAYGQAMAMGSLQGQEKNQFINAGVDIWGALTRFTGKKIGELQDMMSKRQITATLLSDALTAEAKRLKPVSEQVAASMKGQLTKIQNLWYNFRAGFSKSQLWKDATKGVTAFVDTLSKYLSGPQVEATFKAMDRFISNLVDNIKRLYQVVTDNFPAMVTIASLALWAFIPVIKRVVDIIILQLARIAIALYTNPVYLMVAAIAALVAVLIDLDDAAAGRETVVKWSKDAVEGWKLVKQYILIIADAIKSIFDGRAWDALSGWWDRFMVKVKAGIDSLKLWLTEAVAQLPGGKYLLKAFGGDNMFDYTDRKLADARNRLTTQGGGDQNGTSLLDSLWSFGSRFNPIWGDLSAGGQGMNAALAAAAANKANNQGGGTTIINNDNSAVVNATVTEAQDAKATGKEITQQVKDHQAAANAVAQSNAKTAVKQ